MQAALDLANSGYYVYLVERSSPIGGVMAQLDKTFLTKEEIWGLPLTFDKSNRTFGWF
jgi:heterodisulfide reductase subunit A-like polyferredoxin